MVDCHIEFSWTLNAVGKGEEAGQEIRRAVELAEKSDKDVPANRRDLLKARNYLATLLTTQQPDEAEKILRANLALADDALNLEAVHRSLGELFRATQRLPQAEEAFRQAVKYAEQLAGGNPSANWVHARLANDKRSLAGAIAANHRPAEAEEVQRERPPHSR